MVGVLLGCERESNKCMYTKANQLPFSSEAPIRPSVKSEQSTRARTPGGALVPSGCLAIAERAHGNGPQGCGNAVRPGPRYWWHVWPGRLCQAVGETQQPSDDAMLHPSGGLQGRWNRAERTRGCASLQPVKSSRSSRARCALIPLSELGSSHSHWRERWCTHRPLDPPPMSKPNGLRR